MLGLIYKDDQNVLEEKVVNGVPLLTYPLLERTNVVKHGFSTRIGGVSKGCFSSLNLSFTRGDEEEAVRENFRRISVLQEVMRRKLWRRIKGVLPVRWE